MFFSFRETGRRWWRRKSETGEQEAEVNGRALFPHSLRCPPGSLQLPKKSNGKNEKGKGKFASLSLGTGKNLSCPLTFNEIKLIVGNFHSRFTFVRGNL